jgi:cystathionine beta-lyase/cystathionine gamma-synthase
LPFVTNICCGQHDACVYVCHVQVVYCETVSNPTLVVADLPALATIAHNGEPGLGGRRCGCK